MPITEIVQSIIPVLNLFFLVLIVVRSRRWTGPGLNVRVESLEEDVHVIRGNLTRVDRDLIAWHRASIDSNDAIIKQLDAIRDALHGEMTVRVSLEKLRDDMNDMKEVIENLPALNLHLPQVPDKADPPESDPEGDPVETVST